MNETDFDRLIEINKVKGEIRNTHINIGTGVDQTIKELAELIKRTIGYQGSISWDSSKPDGTMRKLMDVGKLHSLGWRAQIDLASGISKVYSQY
jgi:GDP-L-fucose synthase